MADELPNPISREDELLHNIADGTPDISELVPQSREEVYLKYIALNGGSGGGGGGDVTIVQTTGQSTTSVMSQKAVTDNLNKKVNTVDGKGLSTEDFTTEEKEKLNNIPNNLDQLGTAAYCDTGTSEGNVPIINAQGKLDNSVIPSLAITDTFVAENEDEMLNLPGAEKGDICIRTDENKTYILDDSPKEVMTLAENTTELSDWVELKTPTSEVTSVNGKKGDVTLDIPTVVQTSGTSTTDVMSQKAVSENVCFGSGAVNTGTSSSAFGNNARATGNYCLVFGDNARAASSFSSAFGYSSQANNGYSSAFGMASLAGASYSSAFGWNASVTNSSYSVALGASSKADEASVVSVGDGSTNANYGTRRIVNVKDPVNAQDATTKNYVDNKLKKFTATVGTTWAQSETGEYTQEAEIADILETDTPMVDVVLSDDLDGSKALIEAWACVSRISTLDGKIKLYCYETAPTVEIPISLICIR